MGSLASSRGSLNTSSRGSLNSLNSTDLYYNQGDQPVDLDYQYKLDFILQEKCGYIPSGPITTIHENEVVSSHEKMGYSDSSSSLATSHAPKITEPPKSVTSFSSRSSLSSLSPPESPLVLEGGFSVPPQDSPLHHFTMDFEDCDLPSDFTGITTCEKQILLDSETRMVSNSRCPGIDFSRRTRTHLLDEKTDCVSAAVSDESVAGDSGVYEASVKQPNSNEEVTCSENDTTVLETAQVQIGLRYDTKSSSFVIVIMQLQNLQALSIFPGNKIYFRLALLPPSTDISCLFRTKFHPATEPLLFSEMFRTVLSQAVLQKKTLRVDICSVSKSHQEECLGGIQISLGDVSFSNELSTLWYNLLSSKLTAGKRHVKPKKYSVFVAANPSPVAPVKYLKSQQHPFVRNSMIVRSQTFSPGERNQYICRLNRSDSDSSTLAKRTLFVRNSTERRSLRVKRPTCQSNLRRAMRERLVRTSLDLELDLQASRTRQSRLNDELQTLRALRQKLEEMKATGQTDLPPCILEDERFQKLLKQAEKEAEQSKDKKKQGLNAEKLMRKASKDVCRLREQSQKVPVQVQSFREKMAYFTRAKISIPALPADDV
uniref:WW and C2 domain containing 2 n=1 Tax=Laticauda laticaudata TaxID=8630 RepID=A0A8C5RMF2_LATLA